jgi:hypothetical protein
MILTEKGKKQDYINKCGDLMDNLQAVLNGEAPTPDKIGKFAGSRAYVDIAVTKYKFLNDYADFSENELSELTAAIRDHCRQTFEEQARNAVIAYKMLLSLFQTIQKLTLNISAN